MMIIMNTDESPSSHAECGTVTVETEEQVTLTDLWVVRQGKVCLNTCSVSL